MTLRRVSIVIAAILLLATAVVLSSQAAATVTYENQDAGIRLEMPREWVVTEQNATILLADPAGTIENGGASISISTARKQELGIGEEESPLTLVDVLTARFAGNVELTLISPPTPTIILGQPAATAQFTTPGPTDPLLLISTVIFADDTLALVLAIDASGDGKNRAALGEVVDSIELTGTGATMRIPEQ